MRAPKFVALSVLAMCCAAGAQTMYRCGNTFSQTPCGADARSIPSTGKQRTPAATTPTTGQTEAQRLEAIVSDSQRDRRKRDLRERILPEAEAALVKHTADCEQRQSELAASQYAYRQNLYGKTHAAQIASEIAASAATCNTKDRELRGKIELAAKECATLRCR